MTTEIEKIDKTITLTYDDISRMKDFCCKEEGGVSRDFMDWYLKDETFFAKTGMLIVNDLLYPFLRDDDDSKRYNLCLSFDFTNPGVPNFAIYNYTTQKKVCSFKFHREDNLSMKDVTVKLDYYNKSSFDSLNGIFATKGAMKDAEYKLMKFINKQGKSKSKKELKKASMNKMAEYIHYDMCNNCIYFIYATMYYFSQFPPKEEVATFPVFYNGSETELVASKYKYTGYIDLSKNNKVYVPIIKKDKDEPKREFQRHIQKWTVRGHYRRVNGKLIWIEEHEKGEGTLEKRVYGTENESEVNIRPQVFDVVRKVQKKETEKSSTIEQSVEKVKKNEAEKNEANIDEVVKPKVNNSVFKNILSFIKNLFKRNGKH